MRVIVIGAGGHGTVVVDVLLRMREAGHSIEPVACVDDHPPANLGHVLSVPVVAGGVNALTYIPFDAVVIAIGDNATRRRIGEDLRRAGVMLAVARHPSSVVARDAMIGPGTVICAGAVINPATRIGCSVIVNTHASVDHHNQIGDYVHVAPGAHLGGGVSIGEATLVGIGSSVLPGRRIGRDAVIGAGSVVVTDLPARVTAFGVPARIHDAAGPTESAVEPAVGAAAVGRSF